MATEAPQPRGQPPGEPIPSEPTPRTTDEQQDQQGEAPESPPLPTRHTAVTPGPRAARLEQLYDSSLTHALSKISWDNFAACYPTIAARAPDTLRHVQRQMVERLRELCNKEFAMILQNRSVVAKLNELESLISEAGRRREAGQDGGAPVPPHLLPASDILAAHMAPHLAAHQSQLNARLQTVQAHNSKLFEEIQAQRTEMAALLGEVEKALADVDGANRLLDDVAGDLAVETRAAEVEMGGT